MRRWRIYYADGSTFDSSEGEPEDATAFGVVVIAQTRAPDDVHGLERELQHGWDWYWWHAERGEWWGSDIHGLLDHLLHRTPVRAVVQGRSVPTARFRAFMEAAGRYPE